MHHFPKIRQSVHSRRFLHFRQRGLLQQPRQIGLPASSFTSFHSDYNRVHRDVEVLLSECVPLHLHSHGLLLCEVEPAAPVDPCRTPVHAESVQAKVQ